MSETTTAVRATRHELEQLLAWLGARDDVLELSMVDAAEAQARKMPAGLYATSLREPEEGAMYVGPCVPSDGPAPSAWREGRVSNALLLAAIEAGIQAKAKGGLVDRVAVLRSLNERLGRDDGTGGPATAIVDLAISVRAILSHAEVARVVPAGLAQRAAALVEQVLPTDE